jgi:hypothetical protein
MKHMVRKAFFDFEKEERFLNQMSAKGLALTDYTWCKYVFEDAPQGEYTYRIELLEKQVNDPESQNYLRFMEETGAELVASYHRWVYFRRRASDGEFNIYSDIESRIKHYGRIRTLFLLLVAINLIVGLINYFYGNVETSAGLLPVNSYVSIFSFIVAALLLVFLVLPLHIKVGLLEKERSIRE